MENIKQEVDKLSDADLKGSPGEKGYIGPRGMPGPSGMTQFQGEWDEKKVELQSLCFPLLQFLKKNPEVAEEVIITKDKMVSRSSAE